MTHIVLEHGDGGSKTRELVQDIFLSRFQSEELHELGDSALLRSPGNTTAGEKLAFTTDSYVVQPPRFPGGDIGKLAVAGTVNDLAVAGATPLFLTAGFILEEGLSVDELASFVDSMARSAGEAGVEIVAGDTKVVPRGEADGLYINTAGVGRVPADLELSPQRVLPGDVLLINGAIGEHGVAVLATRTGLEFETPVKSDCAPLNGLIESMLRAPEVRPHLRFMRDATRGGVVGVLHELSQQGCVQVLLEESALPITDGVHGACELLGVDPLQLANEGKVIVAVAEEAAAAALSIMRSHPLGRRAARIGTVGEGAGRVLLRTQLGGTRRLRELSGAPLPRIC